MAHTLTFNFGPENGSEAPSPYDEGAVHDSFHQLIQEQSWLAEQELMEMQQMTNVPSRERENVAYTASSARQTEALEASEQTEEHPGFSSATLRILASMPSRTIGRSRGAILSQYYNRTARLRRRSTRPPLQEVSHSARPSLRQLEIGLDSSHEEMATKRSLLVKELQSLPASQRVSMLQTMPLSLAEKRGLRQDSSGHSGTLRKPKTTAPLSHCSRLKYYIIIGFRNLWYSWLSFFHMLQPWHYSLKQISGRFGSSILSYFLFLKTLITFNLFLFLILMVFVVAMQAAYPSAIPNSESFTGLELLTGAGYFTHTLMYYGYYSNFTLNDPCASGYHITHCQQSRDVRLPYNMPLAYVFVVGASFIVTCILLVYSMSRSFGESYRVGSVSGDLAVKVFCAWDYKVIQACSVRLQSENICTQLKECLAERQSRSHPLNLCKRLQRLVVLLLAWTISLGTVLGCVVAVYYFSEYIHHVHLKRLTSSQTGNEAELLGLPLLVCLINLLMPYMYNLLAVWEKQESPVLEVYIAICRNLILKMVILGLLCYHWLSWKVTSSEIKCWETFVGQELYRLVVIDFIFTLLDIFFGELIWRIILEKKSQNKQRPEFDIARNVLELIYGQTLTWLGVFFAPLLPAVQILKLVLLFYIKKMSLMRNCQSPSKPWRASHMSTIFITLLCFPSFLGASVFLSYTIWSVRPSEICGPFQSLTTVYDSGKMWVTQLEKSNPNLTWFTWIHQHMIQNTFFLFVMSGILLAVIYLNIQVVKGQWKIISLLKEQIANEGEDQGLFLIPQRSCRNIWGKTRMQQLRISSAVPY
ncbi:transmembrane channel-like protein 6 isoform X2 [Sphaerodactylus townsendi]|uniref:transmembrane channel-like protein 6 isoform X2 n=1 Tax=Sphaerodactylus townsendi TaxID=933632 RepID=UPI002026E6DC|nr:transmembrane channel-like protein 6 isoform X2 [Sphaerodactylus townsendi]